jgi:hypothetical protein
LWEGWVWIGKKGIQAQSVLFSSFLLPPFPRLVLCVSIRPPGCCFNPIWLAIIHYSGNFFPRFELGTVLLTSPHPQTFDKENTPSFTPFIISLQASFFVNVGIFVAS